MIKALGCHFEKTLSQGTKICAHLRKSADKSLKSRGRIMDAHFVSQFSIFVLAIFVGYYVVWSVTPALHTPLMAVTNAISSVIIVGALIAVGPAEFSLSKVLGFIAMILAAINIFGGFAVTQRMLGMYKKKPTNKS
jgi:NAD(P) transhydrogenase subunit alpha